MQAKLKGAKVIHADPRFTRTTAVSDIYAPIRAGSDIAFLGGIINYVINSERWNSEPFFREYVTTYTNAATIIDEGFLDTEDEADGKPLGVFSGLGPYKEGKWGLNGFVGTYNPETWQYARTAIGDQGRSAATAQSGEQGVDSGQPSADVGPVPAGPPYDEMVRDLKPPPAELDTTLEDPRCVFQHMKKHFARYTPEMVSEVTGCPPERVVEVAETLLNNSGPDKTSAICYAVGWTQHTYGGPDDRRRGHAAADLGNMGRPGGGIVALRGHATIQGSTDVPTLYHSIHGYMPAPTVLKPHNTVEEYLKAETLPTSYWANMPKFFVSLPEVDVWRRGHQGERLGLRLASPHPRRSLAHADDDRHERGSRARHVRHGAEPRRWRPERALPADGAGQARLAGGERTTSRPRRPPSGTRRRRSWTARSAPRISRPRSSSSPQRKSRRWTAPSPTRSA
jgi:formate dehydrogenase major subunit